MIVLDKLMNYRIPEVRQVLGPKDASLYALSVGLGQDPMDERQLEYVDYQRCTRAMPSQALVAAHPHFWMAAPETGIDAQQLVHGEQGLIIHRPMPVQGELVGRTRIEGVIDKGKGRGALLYWSKTLFDAATDEPIATTESTTFLRADGGFGGPSGPIRAPDPVPDSPPDAVIELATRTEQALFYRLNGDYNPLHADPAAARRAGFPRPILHGLCTFGVVCHALLRAVCDCDAARLRTMRLRFTAPVVPGETIRTEVWKSGAFRARVVERNVIAADNGSFALVEG